MDVANFLSESSFWLPEHLSEPFSWVGHIPFAFWLVETCRPALLVELGTHSGNSYLAFCQAAAPHAPAIRCHAIDTWQGDDYTGAYHESVFERVQKINEERYSGFSSLIRSTFEAAVHGYPDGSIDLLHIDGNHSYEAVLNDFNTWLPKLSDRGIVLLHDTNVYDSRFGVHRFFDEVKGRFPTFEFLHSHGLGMALVGPCTPEPAARLVEAARDERGRRVIQDVYERLGASLEQLRVRKELEDLNHLLGSQLSSTMEDLMKAASDLSANAREIKALRAVLHEVGEHARLLERRVKELEQIAQVMCQERTDLSQTNQELLGQIESLQSSVSWTIMEKVRRVRASLAREGTWRGRLLRSSILGFKKLLVGRASAEATRDQAEPPRSPGFEDLPWEWRGEGPLLGMLNDRFQVLLISHEASRSGAPLLLRRLALELARRDDMQCWIVLAEGGEIEDTFASIAPTLKADVLTHHGVPAAQVPATIGSLFRSAMNRGLVLCSSSALGAYYDAFQDLDIPVVAWIHELSTVIDILGGQELVQSIARTSRKIIVPTHQVRQSLIETYEIDPRHIVTIHYGVDMPDTSEDRAVARQQFREELGLPADALIVLGCGAVEARKGCDLFVQIARTVLHQVESSRLASPAYFVWIGRDNDPNFRVWLDHDIRESGLQDRVRFAGQRDHPEQYSLGADVFVLPSREETFSLVTVEAMVRGIPAIAFRDAGGSAEVLEGCGQTVPYLDVERMAHAVTRLLIDSDFRREQGQLARAINSDRFSWTRFMSLLIPILKEDYGLTEAPSTDSSDFRSTPRPHEKRWRRSGLSDLPRANPSEGSAETTWERVHSSTYV